jgi:hypothetical protein
MSTGRGAPGDRPRAGSAGGPLLSFEGPRAEVLRRRASAMLENCTKAKNGYLRRPRPAGAAEHAPNAPGRARSELTVKMLRAHGGCLGTRSRGRTWTAAISRGEALNSP